MTLVIDEGSVGGCMDNLGHLMNANNTQSPLWERIGHMQNISREELDNDGRAQYDRIKQELEERMRSLFNPAHAPRP